MIFGRLRHYKCRKCGKTFRDYYLPEDKRVCIRCAVWKEGNNQDVE